MFRRWIILVISPFFLASCGLFNKDGAYNITFDSTVPAEQKDLLTGDLELLGELNFSGVTNDDLDKMDLSELSSNSLGAFLQARVRYIVGESYDADSKKTVVSSYFNYYPTRFASFSSPFDRVVTVMTNTGSAVYLAGKKSNVLYSIDVADENIVVNTTRVGVIKIGEGLFSTTKLRNSSPSSLARRLLRLGTLFHEARHSDGNGTNAGFPHTKCNSGEFAGMYACESNTNGPYNLEAMLMRHFYKACSNCSETELAAIQLTASDAASRLTYGAIKRDPQPEFVR